MLKFLMRLMGLIIFLSVSMGAQIWAQQAPQKFMSLRSDHARMRYGPSTDHPIKWVYHKKGWPFQILTQFDQWIKVKDMSGEEGWIHHSLLSSRSYGIIDSQSEKNYVVMRTKDTHDSKAILRIEEGALVRVHECKIDFCKVSVSSYKGYVEKKVLWGIVQTQ